MIKPNNREIWAKLLRCIIVTFLLYGCAGSENVPTVQSDVMVPAGEGFAPMPQKPPPPPEYEKLTKLLEAEGYTGVGLEYESQALLELLYSVFSDPAAKGLQLRLIYTGKTLSFDMPQQSLTIGGVGDKNSILRFIKKKIPKRSKVRTAPLKPSPTPREMETPYNSPKPEEPGGIFDTTD